MNREFDLVVIGAGPAGLIASKTAAEKGLKVALIDVKKGISKITRTCCQFFYLSHYRGGQAYTGPVKVEMEYGKAKFTFPDLNFAVEYHGLLRSLYNWRCISPSGYCIYGYKNSLWGLAFDKEALLGGLLAEVEKLDVNVRNETMGLGAENTSDGVKVKVRDSKGKTSYIEAKKGIVADGVNSRIVESLGLNEKRQKLGEMRGFGYIMDGVECPYHPDTWITFIYPSITPDVFLEVSSVWMHPMASGCWQIATYVWVPDSPTDIVDRFITKSSFATWFKNAKIIKKTAALNSMQHPISEPAVGNFLIIGDAAAPVETWIQGAFACGYQAAKVVAKELGPTEYVDWWKKSFYFNDPKFIQDYFKLITAIKSLNLFFSDEEIDYLYSLLDGRLFPSIPQLFGELAKLSDKICKEKPELCERIRGLKAI